MEMEERIERLELKVRLLEHELAELRRTVLIKPQEFSTPNAAILPPRPQIMEEERPPFPSVEKKLEPATDWEHLIARVWLPRIFIVVLLLGVLWGFTAAIDAGIITEPIRCCLGVLAAAVMYGLGEKQVRNQREGLGQVLLGGSNAVLILSLFAAHMLYELIPSGAGFVLYVLTIGIGVFTSIRHRSQTLMVIAMISGYLIPFLVESSNPNPWVFVGYEVLFSVVMLLISARYNFQAAYMTAFGMLHLPLLYAYLSGDFKESRSVFLMAVFLQHLVLYTLTIYGPCRDKTNQKVALFTGFGLMSLWMNGLYADEPGAAYSIMLAAWSLLYSMTALWAFSRKRLVVLYTTIATFGWLLWLLESTHADYTEVAIIAEGTFAIILGIYLRSKLQQFTGAVVFLGGAISLVQVPFPEIFSPETLSWLVLLAVVPFLYRQIMSRKEPTEFLPYSRGLMWAEALLFLYFITQLTNIATLELSFDLQHLILSAVWLIFAVVVIIVGVIFKKPKVRLAGVLFLFLTLLKIIFIDLPDVSVLIRAVLFIGLGIAGIGVSRILYKKKAED